MGKTMNPSRTVADVQASSALKDLGGALRQILSRDGENELLLLLIDMYEAGHLESLVDVTRIAPIRWWKATEKNSYLDRAIAMVNDVRGGIAEGFLEGLFVFTVEGGKPLDVRWRIIGELGIGETLVN